MTKGGVSMFANDYGFCLLKIRNLRYYGCIDLKSEGMWSCSTCKAILVSESEIDCFRSTKVCTSTPTLIVVKIKK